MKLYKLHNKQGNIINFGDGLHTITNNPNDTQLKAWTEQLAKSHNMELEWREIL